MSNPQNPNTPKPQAPVVTPAQAAAPQQTGEGVAPAGFQRTEQQAIAKDRLAEQAEDLANKRQMFALQEKAFQEDREIQKHIQRNQRSGVEDYFAGENLDYAHFGYRQVQATYPRDTPGKFFTIAKSEGWEPVRGTETNLTNGEPILRSLLYRGDIDFDNAIRIGDCVLMQMPRFQHEAWLRARDIMNQQVQDARRSSTVDQRPGTIIHDSLDDPIVQRIMSRGEATPMEAVATVAGQALAKGIGNEQHYENVRAGTVPGAVIGGR